MIISPPTVIPAAETVTTDLTSSGEDNNSGSGAPVVARQP